MPNQLEFQSNRTENNSEEKIIKKIINKNVVLKKPHHTYALHKQAAEDNKEFQQYSR